MDLPRFDAGETEGGAAVRRGVPAVRVGGRLVTTVFDLLMAQYAVPRDGPARRVAGWLRRREYAGHPGLAGGDHLGAGRGGGPGGPGVRPQRRAVPGPVDDRMGAGTNHWYHSDQIYRTFFTLIMLCGCQGVNGGGWAHYVGQEKVRPLTGWSTMAFALDWQRPTRHMTGTSFFYLHTDQWRYENFGAARAGQPAGARAVRGPRVRRLPGAGIAARLDPVAPGVRPQPARSWPMRPNGPGRAGSRVHRRANCGQAGCGSPREDPDDPANWPRVMTVWRANLLGSSGKGMEYFMRHLLGADDAVRAEESPPQLRPAEVTWREEAPRGKLDLLTAIDFRMTSTCTYADVVLPAATWYEKHDISTTDMHPFVHSFNPAIAPPWQTRTDFDAFTMIAGRVLPAGRDPPGQADRRDRRPADARHPRRAGPARRAGAGLEGRRVRAGARGDHAAAGHRRAGLPGAWRRRWPRSARWWTRLGTTAKGVTWMPAQAVDYLRRANGTVRGGDGRRAAVAGPRRAPGRGDPGPVRHHERAGRGAGLAGAGETHRGGAGRSGRGARRGADHLRRHPGAAPRGDHLAGVVGQRDRRDGGTRRSRSTSSGRSPGTR